MYSAPYSIRAATVFLAVSLFSWNAARPQTAEFASRARDFLLPARLPPAANPCPKNPDEAYAALHPATAARNDVPAVCDAPTAALPGANPCGARSPVRTGCALPGDRVQADLDAMGKAGQKISLSRQRVLEILQSENACTAWFQEKDPNPAATFRTLSFSLDQKGPDFIQELKDGGPLIIYRNPYVARVFQGDGAYGTITINSNGAFFASQAQVQDVPKEGGPRMMLMYGARALHVGPYDGGTLRAQMTALLHEFGHLLDLLPTDGNDVGGKSVQNTNEVLRFCRAQVESVRGPVHFSPAANARSPLRPAPSLRCTIESAGPLL
jgi:hypothetical protein